MTDFSHVHASSAFSRRTFVFGEAIIVPQKLQEPEGTVACNRFFKVNYQAMKMLSKINYTVRTCSMFVLDTKLV